jgi:hypothetical protein
LSNKQQKKSHHMATPIEASSAAVSTPGAPQIGPSEERKMQLDPALLGPTLSAATIMESAKLAKWDVNSPHVRALLECASYNALANIVRSAVVGMVAVGSADVAYDNSEDSYSPGVTAQKYCDELVDISHRSHSIPVDATPSADDVPVQGRKTCDALYRRCLGQFRMQIAALEALHRRFGPDARYQYVEPASVFLPLVDGQLEEIGRSLSGQAELVPQRTRRSVRPIITDRRYGRVIADSSEYSP